MDYDPYLEERAEERVMERNGFYLHLGLYGAVALGLAGVYWFWDGEPWLITPVVGWGMAVLLHGFITFLGQTRRIEGWRRRRVASEIEKLKHRRS